MFSFFYLQSVPSSRGGNLEPAFPLDLFFFEIRSCFENFTRRQTSQINQSTTTKPIHPTKMPLPLLPLDIWYEVFVLLDIDEAIAFSKADPRFLGAYIESKQGIRFRNAINSYMRSNAVYLPVGHLSSFVCKMLRGSSLDFSSLISWLGRRFSPVLSSSIVVNSQLFVDLSSTIALNDRGFVSVSSSVSDWTVELKDEDGRISSFSWILLHRASLSGYRAADFHQACDGMGKCVVVVNAENGRIAAAYNADGFTSVFNYTSPNLNGFIAPVADDGGCGEIFNRNDQGLGVLNDPSWGPVFGNYADFDIAITNNCHHMNSLSNLGASYGTRGPGVNETTLFGHEWFRVLDYEVFKIVIE
jgi:hypothetical protein